MEAADLYKVLKHHPFQPVRIHVSDGATHDIRHPDQVILDRRAVHIGVSANGSGPFQEIDIVANMHITRVTPLKAARKSR